MTLPFGFTDSSLWFSWISPLIELNFSFDLSEMSSPQRFYGEPSPSQRRRLVIESPSLRQLVEFKGAIQSILSYASDNPRKRCSQT